MKEFKDLQDLIIRGEELLLKMEDVHERQDRMRLALNRNTNNNREAEIRMDNVIEILTKVEEHANTIVNTLGGIDAEKIRKDISDSFSGVDIEFDWAEINKSMNLRLIKCFEDMHLDKFAKHLNNHMDAYKGQCKQVDTNIKQLQALNDAVDRLKKQIPELEFDLSELRTKKYFIYGSILATLGAVSGSILTYFIMQ